MISIVGTNRKELLEDFQHRFPNDTEWHPFVDGNSLDEESEMIFFLNSWRVSSINFNVTHRFEHLIYSE